MLQMRSSQISPYTCESDHYILAEKINCAYEKCSGIAPFYKLKLETSQASCVSILVIYTGQCMSCMGSLSVWPTSSFPRFFLGSSEIANSFVN